MTTGPFSLVADIGGTNTRVALARGATLLHETISLYKNNDFNCLELILQVYLAQKNTIVHAVCIAAAGPVAQDVALMTNLDWRIEAANVARATGARHVALLNDLQAQGHALGRIDSALLLPILSPKISTSGDKSTKLVVGIGTGFNAAPVHHVKAGRLVVASECGHVNLPLSSTEDYDFVKFLQKNHSFLGVEEVLSGRGLEHLYIYTSQQANPKAGSEIMRLIGQDPTCEMAARLFMRFLGAAVGNLALTHLPFGGIYLCGGVARAFAPYFEPLGFEAAFSEKGRFAPFMAQFSVSLVTDDFAALTGSAVYLAAEVVL
jgi:glucokinase